MQPSKLGKKLSLKIIGAGLGRTGTLTLKNALEVLGFGPCHHMFEIRKNPGLLPAWAALSEGGSPDWESIFRGYSSQVDWPGAFYWRELARYYPEAKVILTIRDPDAWFESMQKTIVRSIGARNEHSDPVQKAISTMANNLIGKNLFDGKITDRTHCIKVFKAHIDEVKSTIASERLLVLDVKDGWAQLCDFLSLDIPKVDFPVTNSSQEFNKSR